MGLVFDCFPFFNELDLLELRLEELAPVVDKFVIVESDTTFRGNHKPLNFLDNHERFAAWQNKIVYHVVKGTDIELHSPDPQIQPWEREYWQRNAILTALRTHGAKEGDTIVLSDLDEIPRRSSLLLALPLARGEIVDMALNIYCYGINIRAEGDHTIKVFNYKFMTTPQQIRTTPPVACYYDAGWEFSSMGTPETISYKLQNFAHWEVDRPEYTDPDEIRARIEARTDLLGGGKQFTQVDIDDTWPEAVKNNRDYWKRYEW